MRRAMDRIFDRWPNPGDLLHAALEGWVIADVSDVSLANLQPMPLLEPRRGPGIQSFRMSRTSVSARLRPAR